ncbi:acetyltransferase [Clostridia bacterium]|nr:acetyltransferase [Clostridia bacterium]
MLIRKTTAQDLPSALKIYSEARVFMRENGNPTQWKDYYPPEEMIKTDITTGRGYVCEDGGEVVAVFYFNIEQDPTYDYIEGAWLYDADYGVVHRIAVRRGTKGVGAYCLNWAYEQCRNLKIDTHEDNIPMLKLLDKLGFVHCGKIWVLDGTEERVAFQKVRLQP